MGIEREFEWDDQILEESSGFELMPEGEYDFTVTKFERGRHTGSAKLPPCNKAILTLELSNAQASGSIIHNLFLHTKTEGLLSAFFIAIGQKKHGEPLRMNWQAVIGAKGKCKVGVRSWTGKDGQEKKSNEISKFLEPSAAPAQSYSAAPTFTPGAF